MPRRATDARDAAGAQTNTMPATGSERLPPLDLNAIVAYNVKAIRLVRRLTQDQVADRLAAFTGHRLPQASISQMERAFDGVRRRLFDAHDLYLLSKVFEVPIVYFFLPPPTCLDRDVAHTGEAVTALPETLFGTPTSLRAVDSRLIEIAPRPDTASISARHEPRDIDGWHRDLSVVSTFDCNARLREIATLLQELVARHRAELDASVVAPSATPL